MKLQTEIRKLVEKIFLYLKVKKFAIYYHKPKLVYRLKSGKSVSFIESDGEMVDEGEILDKVDPKIRTVV